jgi:hypothetical protein
MLKIKDIVSSLSIRDQEKNVIIDVCSNYNNNFFSIYRAFIIDEDSHEKLFEYYFKKNKKTNLIIGKIKKLKELVNNSENKNDFMKELIDDIDLLMKQGTIIQ